MFVLRSYSVEGYKPFATPTTVRLRPITVFVGKNNSGKTSLARALPLVLQIFSGRSRGFINLEEKGITYGSSLRDLLHARSSHGTLRLEVTFEYLGTAGTASTTVRDLYLAGSRPQPIVAEMSLRYGPYSITAKRQKVDHEQYRMRIEDGLGRLFDRELHVNFVSAFPTIEALESLLPELQLPPEIKTVQREIGALYDSLTYLGPHRTPVKAFYVEPALGYESADDHGSSAPSLLATSAAILTRAEQWFTQQLGGWSLRVQEHGPVFELSLHSPFTNAPINLSHSGEGVGQLLPIVVDCLRPANPWATQVIEQPELHLHPSAHGAIADLLLDTMSNRQCSLIETHSEVLLLRLRRRVAERTAHPHDIGIYWIEQTKPGVATARSVQIYKNGGIKNWPRGVFNEDFLEVMALRRAARS